MKAFHQSTQNGHHKSTKQTTFGTND